MAIYFYLFYFQITNLKVENQDLLAKLRVADSRVSFFIIIYYTLFIEYIPVGFLIVIFLFFLHFNKIIFKFIELTLRIIK